jgi:hypothetical protein
VARQVRQVGFWIISAQAGIALALAIPGEAVLGLVGPEFVMGTAALAFLLFAEVVAATAAVSEAALVYVARHRNLLISLLMIATQAVLTVAIIIAISKLPIREDRIEAYQSAGAAVGLMLALAMSSVLKSRLLRRLLGAPVQGWRWPLLAAAGVAAAVGFLATMAPEWLELILGIPAILIAFGFVLWTRGFGPEDRELFRMRKAQIEEMGLAEPGPGGAAPR